MIVPALFILPLRHDHLVGEFLAPVCHLGVLGAGLLARRLLLPELREPGVQLLRLLGAVVLTAHFGRLEVAALDRRPGERLEDDEEDEAGGEEEGDVQGTGRY